MSGEKQHPFSIVEKAFYCLAYGKNIKAIISYHRHTVEDSTANLSHEMDVFYQSASQTFKLDVQKFKTTIHAAWHSIQEKLNINR